MLKSLTAIALLLLLCPLGASAQEEPMLATFDDSQMPRAFGVGSAAGGAGADLAFSIGDGDEGPRVNGARCTRIYPTLCACVASNVGHCYPEICNSGCYGF